MEEFEGTCYKYKMTYTNLLTDFLPSTNHLSQMYGTVSWNTCHCNFQILTQVSSQIYNFISYITSQNDDICNTTNTTCQFSFKQYNLFYTVQKHEICPFMETVPHEEVTPWWRQDPKDLDMYSLYKMLHIHFTIESYSI